MYNVGTPHHPQACHRAQLCRHLQRLGLHGQGGHGQRGPASGFAGSTSTAHVVIKGDLVLYVKREDVLEIIAGDVVHT